MVSYTQAAMERAMKVQGVILRAMAKKITWWQAAEIIGISDRQMRRWRERYEEFGFRGLFDRRRGKPSPKRVAVTVVEKVLGLYREKYFDLNVRHFHDQPFESLLTRGSGRSVSLFACVDGFCDVFPSVSQILDLSTNFFTCGCDLVQSSSEFISE